MSRNKGWEAGDKVFIFFNGRFAKVGTGYLEMTYDGSVWTIDLRGIKPEWLERNGTLTALFLPFNSADAEPFFADGAWKFRQNAHAHYLEAPHQAYYLVKDEEQGTITLMVQNDRLEMRIPDGSYSISSTKPKPWRGKRPARLRRYAHGCGANSERRTERL